MRTSVIRISCILFLVLSGTTVFADRANAQGGIGNQPREDLVMLRAVVQDSLSAEVFNRILALKRFSTSSQFDSAAAMIAHSGGPAKEERWARAVNLATEAEKTRATALFTKLSKLFGEFPDQEKKYFAVFKDKDNPLGQKQLYQISLKSGKKSRMVSFTFYPVGEQLLLGDVY